MADAALLTNFQNFLYELQGDSQQTFAKEEPLLALLSGAQGVGGYDPGYKRYDRGIAELSGDRETYSGSNVRFPIQLNEVPSGGFIAEGATWNAAAPIDTNKATATLVEVVQPIALSLALARDAESGSTSAMSSVEMYTRSAYRATAWLENVALHGAGDGVVCAITNGDSDGLVATVGTTAPFDVLRPGTVVDVLVTADGTNPGQGKRRKVASVDRVAGTVTFSTTQVASDGGSGNITLSTNGKSIYLAGSRSNAMAGLGSAVAVTGTFEGIDKAAVAQWQGIKITASAALGDTILDDAIYKGRSNGAVAYDFGIAHPKVIDLYKAAKGAHGRFEIQTTDVLNSGIKGIVYQGGDKPFPLVKDLAAPRQKCRLVVKDDLQLFGDAVGPEFIQDDGSMWRMFNRATVKEADLLDRVQLGAKNCNRLVDIQSITEAA